MEIRDQGRCEKSRIEFYVNKKTIYGWSTSLKIIITVSTNLIAHIVKIDFTQAEVIFDFYPHFG